jgi:hypothetical protein
MTVLGKGWVAAKPTTASSYIALGRNALRTLLPERTLQLGDITVGENRIDSTGNTVPCGIFIATGINVCTLMWCFLCRNLVTVISLASIFRPVKIF